MTTAANARTETLSFPPQPDRSPAHLRLTLSRVDGVLVRVLGVVVRRGFEPVDVRARVIRSASAVDVLALDLHVESPYPAAGLAAHLAKLLDVHRVEVLA